jgi:ABC-type maltose transport system permease subunit
MWGAQGGPSSILLARLLPTIILVIALFVLAFLLRLLDTQILSILIYLYWGTVMKI